MGIRPPLPHPTRHPEDLISSNRAEGVDKNLARRSPNTRTIPILSIQ